MQLRLTTDYTVRVLLCLADCPNGALLTLREISQRVNVTPGYLRKVVTQLREAGLIGSDQGSKGGFSLARPAEQITLYDAIMASEDTVKINRCLEPDLYCPRNSTSTCKVHAYLQLIQADVEERLRAVSMAQLLPMDGQ